MRERAVLVAKERPHSLTSRRAHAAAGPGHAQQTAHGRDLLEELESLACSAGATTVGRLVQRSRTADPRFLIGAGKAQELSDLCRDTRADLVIFNAELTPAQVRHLESMVRCKVIDRTQLILDIFAQRARSREGQLQVELAQLRYLLPRLPGEGTLMSRLGGGIGTRGPGETKLEVDRRRLRQRIRALERSIGRVSRTRSLHRRHRRHAGVPMVALVGYTNAGKSTLFNTLTGAEVAVENRLFETLDPTIRHVQLPHKTVVALSDTVGFVRQLPHSLIAAFMATLEEVRSAQCIIHVVDRSHPEWLEQSEAVEQVLVELGVATTPRVTVFNKKDLMTPSQLSDGLAPLRHGQGSSGAAVVLSALTGTGIDRLTEVIEETVCAGVAAYLFSVPLGRSDVIAQLYTHGRVMSRRVRGSAELIEVELTGDTIGQWGEQWAPFLLPARHGTVRSASISSA